jgi:hypothetical protein
MYEQTNLADPGAIALRSHAEDRTISRRSRELAGYGGIPATSPSATR